MQPYICGRFIDKYLVVCRTGGQGAVINEDRYLELLALSEDDKAEAPEWLVLILSKISTKFINKVLISNLVLVRRPGTIGFAKASYEITEACNFRCKHCYLGEKVKGQLIVEDKKRVLNMIERAGCLWLQITGGEPLMDRDFIEAYVYAQSLGLLIVLSTNGSLLLSPKIRQVLKKYPPWRLTVSLYGATDDSYEALTQVRGSGKMVFEGLHWAKKNGLRVRINIIGTKYNKDETGQMTEFVRGLGFNYHVFNKITPAIDGDRMPIEVATGENCLANRCSEEKNFDAREVSCRAGKTFFHVNANGKTSVCKIARQSSIDLLAAGVNGLKELSEVADRVLTMPSECETCVMKQKCTICAPMLSLYKINGDVPASVCRRRE